MSFRERPSYPGGEDCFLCASCQGTPSEARCLSLQGCVLRSGSREARLFSHRTGRGRGSPFPSLLPGGRPGRAVVIDLSPVSPRGAACILADLGALANDRGDRASAEAHFTEALDPARALGDPAPVTRLEANPAAVRRL